MLTDKGFNKVFNVSGGIRAWQSKTAVGPPDLGIDLFDGDQSTLEVLKIAYSLEQGLREFYLSMEEKAQNQQVKDLFVKLSDIEVKHQMSIYLAFCDIYPVTIDKDDFEAMVEKKALEGGLSTDEYLDMFNPDLDSPVDVISLAMSIEAQALDLYQRISEKIPTRESRQIVLKIANEEKAHLKSLGQLMDSL